MNEADFIFSKSKELSLTGIKNFPIDFINTKGLSEIEVPEKVLVLGKEFFGSYEVSSATGDFVLTLSSQAEAKYLVYASRNRTSKIKKPGDQKLTEKAVEEYEKYLDRILFEIKKEYQRKINNGQNVTSVSNEIFKKLNLVRL